MKRLILILLVTVALTACKKLKYTPEGPTDVRVRNMSDLPFYDVVVNTSGGTINVGNIPAKDTSDYFRFQKAYPKAEITATIEGETFTTGPVNYTYMTWVGQAKITYHVFISNYLNKTLQIHEVLLDAPLD